MSVLIGADPELFAFKGDKPISVHNLLSGDKRNPLPVDEGAVQVDGTAAEFNIIPTDSVDVFVNRIIKVRKNIESIIQQADKDVVLRSVPAVKFDSDYWATIPSANKELGCDPDFDAYTGKENVIIPEEKRKGFETMRTGSGHIHIGWRNPKKPFKDDVEKYDHFVNCRVLTMLIDNVILPFEYKWDKDVERRKLYGKPGAFRPKPYGLEYRVLSNAWVDQPDIARVLFETIIELVEQVKKSDIDIVEYGNGGVRLYGTERIIGRHECYSYSTYWESYDVPNNASKSKLKNFFRNYKMEAK